MHLTCLAIVLSALAASPAPAPDGGKVDGRSSVQTYLATHDVPTEAELRALGKAPEDALMAVATDTRAEGLIRARAVAALRLLPSPSVHAFLGKMIQAKAKTTDPTDRLILRRAAVTLGWLAGAGAAEMLALLFENDDIEVRLDAVIGLGLTRAASAPKLLRNQLAAESAPRVRDQIERQLRVLDQVLGQPENTPSPKKEQPMRGGW